jgi:type II secretory pathway component PulM
MAGSLRKVIFFVFLAAVAYTAYAYMLSPSNRSFSQQKMQLQGKRQKLAELQQATLEAGYINSTATGLRHAEYSDT